MESLTLSFLGNWINRQRDGVKHGDGGAEERLVAALELQRCRIAIVDGNLPLDTFIRWKPIYQRHIDWEREINDGVRLNISSFMTSKLRRGIRGAGILRVKPNLHWKKDRGKEPIRDKAQFPWIWSSGKFIGDRVNRSNHTIAENRAVRYEVVV